MTAKEVILIILTVKLIPWLLQLCTAVETANKLVQSTDTNVRLLSEKAVELEKVVKRGDSAITAARAISLSLNQKGESSVGSQNKE